MYILGKYMAPIASNGEINREILTNVIIKLSHDIIEKIIIFKKYVIKDNSIQLYITNDNIQEINFDDIIPSMFKRLNDKEKEYYLKTSIILPGFVNGHTHTFETLQQGLFTFNPKMDFQNLKYGNMLDWLKHPKQGLLSNTLFLSINEDKINSIIDDSIWKLAYRKAVYEQLKSGVTYFRDHIWNIGSIVESSIEENETLGIEHIMAIDCSPSVEKSLQKANHIIDNFSYNKKLHFEIAGTDNDLFEMFEDIAKFVGSKGVGFHMHTCETGYQRKKYNGCPAKYLLNKGILGNNTSLAHAVYLDDADMRIIGKTNTKVIVNDRANAYLGSGKCNTSLLKKYNVCIGLGTDGAASIGLDMMELIKFTVLSERLIERNPLVIDSYESIYLGTYSSAKTMGLEKEMGSIEIGKRANIIIAQLNNPIYDPIDTFVYLMNQDSIVSVTINGKEVVDNKNVINIDSEDMSNKLNIVSSILKRR